jgi:murein tripeptide amidase MpaA
MLGSYRTACQQPLKTVAKPWLSPIPLSFSRIGCALLFSVAGARTADILPPVRTWNGASEALIAKADDPWITPSERTGLTETPGYDATVAYLKKLDKASPLISLREFGRTAQGRSLYLVVAAKDRAFTPQAARKTGRPSLLVQAGIHSGEIDGKDAGLMLLRDIALRNKASLLEGANFLFVPIFNVDGHERSSEWNRPNQRGPIRQGWRTTAQNLNLNRVAGSTSTSCLFRLMLSVIIIHLLFFTS